MTAAQTAPAQASAQSPAQASPAPRGPRPHGLGWLMWRQQRMLVWLWLAAILAAAVAFPILRSAMASFIESHHIAGCAEISLDPACQGQGIQRAVAEFRNGYGETIKLLGLLLLALPVAVGAAVGAPLFGHELESGTWKLVLSQSVGRTRWVLAKLATAAVVSLVGSGILALLFHWLWLPAANDVSGVSWYSRIFVVSGGPLLPATVLLGLAVGALAGALLGRVQAAMVVTLGVVPALQYGLATLRPYLWGWHTEFIARSQLPNDVWGFGQGFMRPDGTRLPYDVCGGAKDWAACQSANVDLREFSDVHQAGDYWPLQLVESALCLALAGLLAFVLIRWAARRFGR